MKIAYMITFWLLLILAAPSRGESSFAGTWETEYGILTLTQEGSTVKGFYVMNGIRCTVEGTVEKAKYTFRYQEPGVNGFGQFELSIDGKSFTGKWGLQQNALTGSWSGKRVAAASGAAPEGFQGLWESNFGRIRLVQVENRVHGIYAYSQGSSITGTVEGKKLTFQYKEPSAEGEGWFELATDANSFKGKWKEKGSSSWSDWNGMRVQPIHNRIWLVVIEARWEPNLQDKEYSFGQMLNAFFARTPNVQVRHRFFDNDKSLRKWLLELAYLAEPIVVSLSSHGLPEGIPLDGEMIGAKTIAESLRYVSTLRLFHFSSCCVMKGRIPEEIRTILGPQGQFPISGYTQVVDWAASAVLEFCYFDMILARGMAPAVAAEQIGLLLPYSGDKKIDGAVYAPAGFRILLPGGK